MIESMINKPEYMLRCQEWNARHVKFSVFDRAKANCGTICVLAADVLYFVANTWSGDIDWNDQVPPSAKTNPERYGATPR